MALSSSNYHILAVPANQLLEADRLTSTLKIVVCWLSGDSSQEMEQAEGNISTQRQRQRTYSRFNENADLVGSGHTYKEVILDFVKRWIEENQVA